MSDVEIAKATDEYTISLSEDIINVLLKFCKWAGYELEEYVEIALISDMEAILNSISPIVPLIEELREDVEKLRKKYL